MRRPRTEDDFAPGLINPDPMSKFGTVDPVWTGPEVGFNPPIPPERFIPPGGGVRINPPAGPVPFNPRPRPFTPMGSLNQPFVSPNLPESPQQFNMEAGEDLPPEYRPVPEASPESRAAMFQAPMGRYKGRFGAFSKPFRTPSYGGGAAYSNFGMPGMGMAPGMDPRYLAPGMASPITGPSMNSRTRKGRNLY